MTGLIAEDVLRNLAAAHSFSEISKMLKCSHSTVREYARRYGIQSRFLHHRDVTDAERARFIELRGQGLSVKKIRALTGRSQEAVSRALNAAGVPTLAQKKQGLTEAAPFPKPNISPADGFKGVMFESYRIPEGRAVDATRVRRRTEITMGCAAAMCEES